MSVIAAINAESNSVDELRRRPPSIDRTRSREHGRASSGASGERLVRKLSRMAVSRRSDELLSLLQLMVTLANTLTRRLEAEARHARLTGQTSPAATPETLDRPDPAARLTRREKQVLCMLLQGDSEKEI